MTYRMKTRVRLSDAGMGPAAVGVVLLALIGVLAVWNGSGRRR